MVYLDHLNAKALGRIVSYRRESFSVITWQGKALLVMAPNCSCLCLVMIRGTVPSTVCRACADSVSHFRTGVFFYVYPGIASTASFLLNETNPAFGSLLQVGFAFGFGIAFAIITCGSTSGGQVLHLHLHASI